MMVHGPAGMIKLIPNKKDLNITFSAIDTVLKQSS